MDNRQMDNLPATVEPADVIRSALTELAAKPLAVIETEWLALPQAPATVIHRFGPGIYIREVSIPAGTLAIGHRQKYEQMNVMIKGRVTMLRDDGSARELVAPMVFVGPPGRKMGYITEDMVWQNIYATHETDIAELERTLIDKSEGWLSDQLLRQLGAVTAHAKDREDYLALLAERGLMPALERARAERTDDLIPAPMGSYRTMVAPSPIDGMGLFATSDIAAGESIAVTLMSDKRTPAGRYVNHSRTPNATVQRLHTGADAFLVAAAPIAGCRGGQPGDEITIDYRQLYNLSLGSEKCPS